MELSALLLVILPFDIVGTCKPILYTVCTPQNIFSSYHNPHMLNNIYNMNKVLKSLAGAASNFDTLLILCTEIIW